MLSAVSWNADPEKANAKIAGYIKEKTRQQRWPIYPKYKDVIVITVE
jgi:hypothetical protein